MASDNDPSVTSNKRDRIQQDLDLVAEITSGSVSAWHQFIRRYSGLIYSIVRRYLMTEDEDEIRSVFVDILKAFYDGELARYRGDAPLSSWLIVSTRSRSVDAARKRHGRIRPPEGFNKLTPFDKQVWRLFYLDGLPIEIVIHALAWRGLSADVDRILSSIQRIERTISSRYLKKLDEHTKGRKFGAGPISLLRFLIQQRADFEEKAACGGADRELMEREILDKSKRLRELVAALPEEERNIIFLRFARNMSAREMAETLGIGNTRRVYALINNIVRKLRRAMLDEGE
jgi:RNA polymerase sigma factor (sigma-70 family)